MTTSNRVPSVGQVLAGLDRGPTSGAGRAIQSELNQMGDDYFGRGAPTMEQEAAGKRGAGAAASSGVVARAGGGAGGLSSTELQSALTKATTTAPPELCRSVFAPAVAHGRWMAGPLDPAGVMLDLSDRNLLCLDVKNNLAVAGSADHGLVLCDIEKHKKVRSLYTKTAGHTEWVTTCKFTPDGRVLSGGMDSKLCLWAANAPRCDDLLGHTGSISDVVVNEHNYAISAAYDRTLRVWDLTGKRCSGVLSAHSQPVMQVCWKHATLVSGDRRGAIHCWDPSCGRSVTELATKGGQIGALNLFADSSAASGLVCAGDQSGTLTVWDFARCGATPIFQKQVHPGGVLCEIQQSSPNTANGLLVTAGADRQIHVLEPRRNMQPVVSFGDHKDFIYSMVCAGDSLVLSGGGNGWLLVHDIKAEKCLFGIGASTAAVRAIGFTANKLVCAGDDGKLATFTFP